MEAGHKAAEAKVDAERRAAEAKEAAKRKEAEIKAKAEECRQQCQQKLVAMLQELRSLVTDERSIERFRELDGEHQALVQQMAADVSASLSALNDTFVAEYTQRNSAMSQAEELLRKTREVEEERRRQEAGVEAKKKESEQQIADQLKQLQLLYVSYMELQVCAERFAEFENARSGLREVLKNKEAGLPSGQVTGLWNEIAAKFKKAEAVLKVAGDPQVYAECDQARSYVAGLIMLVPGMGEPSQNLPLRKKDF